LLAEPAKNLPTAVEQTGGSLRQKEVIVVDSKARKYTLKQLTVI
jgi:hypothetical protein